MQTDPFGVTVDPALILAFKDRQQRSARALAAAAVRFTERRAATEAHVRAAVLAYVATSRHPVDRLFMNAAAHRPTL